MKTKEISDILDILIKSIPLGNTEESLKKRDEVQKLILDNLLEKLE